MTTLLVKLFIKDKDNIYNPRVKQKFAVISSVTDIILNLFLCIVKFITGGLSNSVSILVDGFNNMADGVTSLISFAGFKIAGYGRGSEHPFGHGRIEWIIGLFTSIVVLFMGIKLADTSVEAVVNRQKTVFSSTVIVILIISIFVKFYMYCYNKKFAEITKSENLKATAADCISDSAATSAVLFSAVISYTTGFEIDGYCGIGVSIFIIFTGIKSLWEVLGRIMGKEADKDITNTVAEMVKNYDVIAAVYNVMVHDYGFGNFIISMNAEGYKKDSERLYNAVNEISYKIYRMFNCDCIIQIGYILENKNLAEHIKVKVYDVLKRYSAEITIDKFRLIDNGNFINIVFNIIYPVELQKIEEEIRKDITEKLESENSNYRIMVRGIIRREYFLSRIKNINEN